MIPALVRTFLPTAIPALLLASISLAIPADTAARAETAVAQEHSPPGDIPDDQVFVTYKAPQGFLLKVPEGWARQDAVNGAIFSDKYDQIWIEVGSAASAPTKMTVIADQAAALSKTGRAVKLGKVDEVRLPSGGAVRIVYTSNSEPNAVTGKQIREENERYLYFHAGKLVTVDLSAPAGADNADQWKIIVESFRWAP